MINLMSSNSNAAIFYFSTNNSNIILPQGDLYVDTNSWIDIVLSRHHGQATEQFLIKFVGQQNMTPIIVWSPHNEHELLEVLNVNEYNLEANARNITGDKPWKQAENSMPINDAKLLNQRIIQKYESIKAKFAQSLFEIDRTLDVSETTKEIMIRYGVPYKDAIHLAYMWHEEVNNLLTRDKRLANIVPGINIFSPEIKSNGNNPYPVTSFMPDLPKYLKRNSNIP